MSNSSPLVSIITPTYKRSTTLPRAIESVLNSSYKNVEIIIVDDNNNGDEYRQATEQLMKRYDNNPKVNYIKHETNKNGSAARNTGIKAAKGKYLMFLDDDDEFLTYKIEKQVERMESLDDSWAACYTKYLDVTTDGKIISRCSESKEGDLLVYELARNLFVHAGSNLMVRASVVNEIHGFDESFLRNQDVEFLVRILKKYKLAYVNYTGLKVYIHPRKYVIKYSDITKAYLQKFQSEIESLPDNESNKIMKMISLQLIRNAVEGRRFGEAQNLMKENGIAFVLTIRYFLHLLFRKFTKQSYGFNMKLL